MPSLFNRTNNQVLAKSITKASSFLQRLKGLMGKEDAPSGTAFWIPSCPSIHTFFMKFSLDVIFTDKTFRVVSVHHSIPPGKILYGGWKSYHVFEIKTPGLKKDLIKKGDQLNVVH